MTSQRGGRRGCDSGKMEINSREYRYENKIIREEVRISGQAFVSRTQDRRSHCTCCKARTVAF
jgi:hypothetical protein